jgi:hypothetical protein
MLKDNSNTYKNLGNISLSAPGNYSINNLISVIDRNILGFRDFYFTSDQSERVLNHENEGYNPNKFSFGKNPSQPFSAKEADIGVVVLNKSKSNSTIIEFEAKRLSDSSNNSEYVYGKKGGIERFKREHHGEHLSICGMFGYVQSKTVLYWLDKINRWISDLAANNTDHTIDWNPQAEKLNEASDATIEKYESFNLRSGKPAIKLYHYFIDLSKWDLPKH